MKIKSLSDVITNSSHEVFIFRDIKDPGELKRYIKSKTDVMIEPWLFKEEDIKDVDISRYHETPNTPESRFEALRDLLENDKEKYGKCTRFEVQYKDYHKLYKKFLKSKLPASIFLGKYTDQEIKHYLEVGDPWDAHHLIGCWISDWYEDYVDYEILEDLEKKYKNSEYIAH